MANIKGTAANNNLVGTTGNDVIDGLGGADTMAGGLGNDVYIVDNIGDIVIENSNEGIDTVQASISYLLTANVENLQLTSVANINATGNVLNNSLIGNSGNNILDGGVGADTMSGGAGNDTYIVDNTGDVVAESAGAGNDTVQTSLNNYVLNNNVENLTLIGLTAINGTGNNLNNVITGNNANNLLNGGAGADTMIGGLGDDIYIVDNAGDVVNESAAQGLDKVQASVSYVLGANVENLTLTGIANINGTGNTLDNLILGNSGRNILTGDAGNDILNGGAGADTMIGGTGNDTYIVDNAGDIVTETLGAGTDSVQSTVDYTLANNVENLTLLGAATIGTGNTLDNMITGNALNNVLDGGLGNDTIDGAGGSDILHGGLGNDTFIINDASALIIESVGEGTDSVLSSVDYVLAVEVENLTLTGIANIDGTGNVLSNIITGNSSDNILDGGLGYDVLYGGDGNDLLISTENIGYLNVNSSLIYDYTIGGLGDDTYYITTGLDRVFDDAIVELANEGNDTISSDAYIHLDLYNALGIYIENGTLRNAAGSDGITGTAGDNLLTGNDFDNLLIGLGGNDTVIGGLGNDTFALIMNNTGIETIADFGLGLDNFSLGLSNAIGALVDGDTFLAGSGLTTGNGTQQVIYNTDNGNLYYEDGLNADAPIQIANLIGVPTLSASDFIVGFSGLA